MCGIVGGISLNPQKYQKAIDLLSHRGPDASGMFSHKDLFLGHTRLSILDLTERGNQPMFSKDNDLVIVFNGEIYNHLEIREQLSNKYQFVSSSDTETLLYAYKEFGTSFLDKLNGIFAFAIFDKKANSLFLARDHFGVKPLYIYQSEEKFIFSSEMKTFLDFGIDKFLDAEALANYVTLLWSPGESTPFKGVRKLLPGHYMKLNVEAFSTARPEKYYQIPFNGIYSTKSEAQLIEELDQKLTTAVNRQLLSDVPVGFFLSGGLDSSLLVAIAKKIFPEEKLPCFTIETDYGESNEGFLDDLGFAKKVAEHLDVDLKIIKTNVSLMRDFDKMIWHLDEPQTDISPLNVLSISELARKNGIKVLIGGTGGDDLFSGYRRHQAIRLEKYFASTPAFAKKLLKTFSEKLPTDKPRLRRVKKILAEIQKDTFDRLAGYFAWLPYENTLDLFSSDYRQELRDYSPSAFFKELLADIPGEKALLNQLLYWEMKSFLVDQNLNYTDKLSMAVGVEARVPYLDKELVEFSTTIPPSLKMKGVETKYLLKKVAERYLPKEVIYRPKTGFGAPVRHWVTNDLDEMIKDRLSPKRITDRGIFDPEKVWTLIDKNKNGEVDASYTILSLLAIESWMKQFVDEQK